MTTEQLNELERLNERWANGCLTSVAEGDVVRDAMDLLPDVLAHIKQLTAERDAALEACRIAGVGDYKADYFLGRLTETGKLRQERDAAVGESKEARSNVDKALAELSDATRKRIEAERACAEMRDWISDVASGHEGYCAECNCVEHADNCTVPRLLSTSCGKGYHHDDEWKPVVEALKRIYNFPVHSEPVGGAYNMQDIAHEALAHSAKLTEGK